MQRSNLNRILYIWILLIPVLSVGCSQALKSSLELNLGQFQELPKSEANQFVLTLKEQSHNLNSMRTLVDSEIESNFQRVQFRQSLAIKKPDMFRIEFFNTNLNQLSFLIVADGAVLTVVEPRKRLVFSGRQSNEALSYALGFPLQADELFSFLTGRVGESLVSRGYKVFRSVDSKKYFLTAELKKGELWAQFLKIENSSSEKVRYQLKHAEIRGGFGSKRYFKIDYNFHKASEEILPREVIFSSEDRTFSGKLSYNADQVQASQDIPDSVFVVMIPATFIVKDISQYRSSFSAK